MGPLTGTRTFTSTLGGKYIRLDVEWHFAQGTYVELAIIGADETGRVAVWSFTSDGKRSSGSLADPTSTPRRSASRRRCPPGLARIAYWPDATDGFHRAVESRTRRGWYRFTEHHYTAVCGVVTRSRDVGRRLDRGTASVLQYRPLAGRPVWPARDRCDKPYQSQIP